MINLKRIINKIYVAIVVLFVSFTLIACKSDPIRELEKYHRHDDVYYQIFVRSFADSDGDGIGDLNGVASKLDYLVDLGVTAIWLMPIFPSPSYHGYDVIDYKNVNPEYGTIDDLKDLVKKADKLGIKIILDMIFNHSSNEHPWFKAALEGDEKYKDYYVFANSSTDTSALSGGVTVWHMEKSKKYYGFFSGTMPDFNLDNDAVVEELYDISKFWIDLGIDGFRLDAVQHFFWINEYQEKNYTTYQNITFTRSLKRKLLDYNPNFYLTGEIYNTAETIVSAYFNAVDSPLDFPVSERLFKAVLSNSDYNYADRLKQIYNSYSQIYKNYVSAPFLKNHDEDRIASLLSNDIKKMKLAAEMLLTLPGSPIIYYGEEVGMVGVKSSGEASGNISVWDETRRLPFPFKDDYQTTWFEDEKFNGVKENKAIDLDAMMKSDDSIWKTYQSILKVRMNNIALRYGNYFEVYEKTTNYLQGYYREIDERGFKQRVLVLHNLGTSDLNLEGIDGLVLYASNESTLEKLSAKSTIIIDVTDLEK